MHHNRFNGTDVFDCFVTSLGFPGENPGERLLQASRHLCNNISSPLVAAVFASFVFTRNLPKSD